MKTIRERYHSDPHFKALVDIMVSHIEACSYTPTEMREAAILASILYQQSKPAPYPMELEKALREVDKFLCR